MSKIHETINAASKHIDAAKNELDAISGAVFEIEREEIPLVLDHLEIAIKTGVLLAEKIENIAQVIHEKNVI